MEKRKLYEINLLELLQTGKRKLYVIKILELLQNGKKKTIRN